MKIVEMVSNYEPMYLRLWRSEYKEYLMDYIDNFNDGFPVCLNFKDWMKWQLSLETWSENGEKELMHLIEIMENKTEFIECPLCKHKFYTATSAAIKLYEENEQLKSSNSTLIHSFTYYAERCVVLEKEIESLKNKH